MVADAYKDVTKRGELVLHIFLGSGTSLIAAERAGRKFRGLDIDPAFVDLAMQRWSDLTGKEPELVHREPRTDAPVTAQFKPSTHDRLRWVEAHHRADRV